MAEKRREVEVRLAEVELAETGQRQAATRHLLSAVLLWPRIEFISGDSTNGAEVALEARARRTTSVSHAEHDLTSAAATPSSAVGLSPPPAATPHPGMPRTGDTGPSDTAEVQAPAPRITLADLGLAIIAIVLTTFAARNLPATIEIALLQRLDLDTGSRNAVTTLVRYAIRYGKERQVLV